jgi:hypothetical protein
VFTSLKQCLIVVSEFQMPVSKCIRVVLELFQCISSLSKSDSEFLNVYWNCVQNVKECQRMSKNVKECQRISKSSLSVSMSYLKVI